jgi:hypothetical protein
VKPSTSKASYSYDDRVRGTAAQALLDRGFGKPKVEIQNTNADFRDALEQVQNRLHLNE